MCFRWVQGALALPLGARTSFVREVIIERGVVLAGHSLGANKVIYYLSRHTDDSFVKKFFLLSPANLAHMTSGVSEAEKRFIKRAVESGRGEEALPFALMGWVECTANTAHDWCFSGLLDNVFTDEDAKFSRCADITHSGALLIGTFDTFTNGGV